MFTNLCLNLNGVSTKPALHVRHGWVILSHNGCNYILLCCQFPTLLVGFQLWPVCNTVQPVPTYLRGMCNGWIVSTLTVNERYRWYSEIMGLTHWGRVTHICVGNLTTIGSDNGLSPDRRQAIIWTNAGILSIGPLGINFSEIAIEIQAFSFRKMRLKSSSAKWRPSCLGLNVLKPTLQLMEQQIAHNWHSLYCQCTDTFSYLPIQNNSYAQSMIIGDALVDRGISDRMLSNKYRLLLNTHGLNVLKRKKVPWKEVPLEYWSRLTVASGSETVGRNIPG